MERYSKILKSKEGKRYYATVLYPLPEPNESDIYVTTVKGDRLDIIANDYYGDPTLYFILISANNLKRDSLYPPVGFQLRIPTDISNFIKKFKQINNR